MAYSQNKKITYNEKRLLQLKQQLYGKETSVTLPTKGSYTAVPTTHTATPNYLIRDLWKITIFAVVAIVGQFSLWYAVNHSWLKLY